jgi:hypothetical protein
MTVVGKWSGESKFILRWIFNPLKMRHRLLYLKTQFILFISGIKTNQFMV